MCWVWVNYVRFEGQFKGQDIGTATVWERYRGSHRLGWSKVTQNQIDISNGSAFTRSLYGCQVCPFSYRRKR
jgi:hypothetical protein